MSPFDGLRVTPLYAAAPPCDADHVQTLGDEVREFLEKNDFLLNKNLGQHFLTDERILGKIVEIAKISPNDAIVEIGAGLGILTRELVKNAEHVTAIELDKRWAALLPEFIGDKTLLEKLTLIRGDALKTPMPDVPYAIVANIPYQISAPLLRHVFLDGRAPRSLTLLVQREFADKICDPFGGRIAILVGLFGAAKIALSVSPAAFIPQPKVDSAVLRIECFPKPLADPATLEKVFALTEKAFQGKRKMLRGTIGKIAGVADAFSAATIDPERRPQTLTIQEWIELAGKWNVDG